nr:hypothetical protein [Oligoflexales bacterium]
ELLCLHVPLVVHLYVLLSLQHHIEILRLCSAQKEKTKKDMQYGELLRCSYRPFTYFLFFLCALVLYLMFVFPSIIVILSGILLSCVVKAVGEILLDQKTTVTIGDKFIQIKRGELWETKISLDGISVIEDAGTFFNSKKWRLRGTKPMNVSFFGHIHLQRDFCDVCLPDVVDLRALITGFADGGT